MGACGGGGELLEGLEDLRWKLYRVTWDPLQPPIKPGSIKRQMAVGIIGKPRRQSTKPGLIMDYNNLPWGQPATGLHLKKRFKSRNGSVSFSDICFKITDCEPIAFHQMTVCWLHDLNVLCQPLLALKVLLEDHDLWPMMTIHLSIPSVRHKASKSSKEAYILTIFWLLSNYILN